MDFFRKRVEEIKEKEEISSEEKEFVSDISLYEFENVNWTEFGGKLKQKRILPNSYAKKPTSVEFKLRDGNRPAVFLTFDSTTTHSFKKFMLFQDGAYGTVDSDKNADLVKLWNEFKDDIRARNQISINHLGYLHKEKGKELWSTAKKMIELGSIYEREQEFLEKYSDAEFDGFEYGFLWEKDKYVSNINKIPQFSYSQKDFDGDVLGEYVVPFSPKTLEYCIVHLSDEQKSSEGADLEEFEKKCRMIQEYSAFETEDWDKVINIAKTIVKQSYDYVCKKESEDSLVFKI